MSEEEDKREIREMVIQFYDAINSMLNGDPKPLEKIYSHAEDVTYMPAEGGFCLGWSNVYADWKKQAEKSLGGKTVPADIQITLGNGMACTHSFSKGKIKNPQGDMQEIFIRESSVFRKENGKWKMIAHHADSFPLWQKILASD